MRVFDNDWSAADAWNFQGIDENNQRIEIKMTGQPIYDRIFFLKHRIEVIQAETKIEKDLITREFNQDRILKHLRVINELKMIINMPEL